MPDTPKIRLLLISYLFPPSGGIAVQRALSLAKYLPNSGFEVHVLSARNAAGPVMDPSLLKQIPPSVSTHEAFTPEIPFHLRQRIWRLLGSQSNSPRKAEAKPVPPRGLKKALKTVAQRILCPEPEILWAPFAVSKSREIIRRAGIQVVLITVPPFSALVVGTKLKREFPHLKFVADFRDEWLDFYLNEFDFQNSAQTRRRAVEIERDTVEASDLVVAVTETSLATIRNRYPKQPDSKFGLIYNGYDPEVISPAGPAPDHGSKLVVVHMGTVYTAASPRYYLDALDALPEELRSRFETRFIGRVSEEQAGVLDNRRTHVRVLGFMPQAQAVKQVAAADFLLLTMTNEISLPGKLFEYLALGKPILALAAKNSEVSRIIARTSTGLSADPGNPAEIRSMLTRIAAESTAEFRPAWDVIRQFERPRLVASYASRIRDLF